MDFSKVYTDDVDYVIVKLHPRAIIVAASIIAEIADPFTGLIIDKDEVTLIIPQEMVEEFEARLKDAQIGSIVYRLITLDIIFDLDVVGIMAQLSRKLADANIPIMAFSSFSRDHLLVPQEHINKAIEVLKQ